MTMNDLEELLKSGKPMDPEKVKAFSDAMSDAAYEALSPKAALAKECKWCGSKDMRPLQSNGIIGPGYTVFSWVCNSCGRVT